MKNDSKTAKILQVINRITEDPLLHLPFAGNIVSVLKPAMMENDICAYPILCLTGEPQSGKSTVARTVIIDKLRSTAGESANDIENHSIYIITDINVSKLKKILRKRQNDYVVLDDFAVFQDSDSRRKSGRFLDETVRPSFAGTSALLLLTAETGAFDKITDSLHSRMITLPMNDWKFKAKSKQLLEDIYHIRPDLSKMLQEFSEWTDKRTYDIRPRSLDFQQKYSTFMDDRSASLFFAYDLSMEEFSKFLAERYGMSFSINTFRNSYMEVWKKNHLRSLNRAALVKHLFMCLLKEGAFACKIPSAKQLCQNYCRGHCSARAVSECSGNKDNCDYYEEECGSDNYYDPYELILNNENNSAVLITSISCIYGMPKYKQIQTPLFIISQNKLINMLNNALEKFCIKMNTGHNSFRQKELSSLLNKSHMCVFRASGDHLCYTFPYITEGSPNSKDSVYILRVSKNEYELICKRNQRKLNGVQKYIESKNIEYLYHNYSNMPQILLQLCNELQWRYEGTDSYTKEQYNDIEP